MKATGLGDALYAGGTDISGDINSLGKISGGPAALDLTDITQSAYNRLGGIRDGSIEFVAYHDTAVAHPVLSALPTADTIISYLRGTTLGNPMASVNAKQVNYDGTRGTDGGLTFAVQALANGYGLEWGVQLTAGMRTDTAATNGTSYDTAAAASFGGQAYLQCSAFTGTDVTISVQDSADNSSFTNVSGLVFTQITGSTPLTQRLATGNTATIRRYVRVATVTTGGVTSVTFAVQLTKNSLAGQVF